MEVFWKVNIEEYKMYLKSTSIIATFGRQSGVAFYDLTINFEFDPYKYYHFQNQNQNQLNLQVKSFYLFLFNHIFSVFLNCVKILAFITPKNWIDKFYWICWTWRFLLAVLLHGSQFWFHLYRTVFSFYVFFIINYYNVEMFSNGIFYFIPYFIIFF